MGTEDEKKNWEKQIDKFWRELFEKFPHKKLEEGKDLEELIRNANDGVGKSENGTGYPLVLFKLGYLHYDEETGRLVLEKNRPTPTAAYEEYATREIGNLLVRNPRLDFVSQRQLRSDDIHDYVLKSGLSQLKKKGKLERETVTTFKIIDKVYFMQRSSAE